MKVDKAQTEQDKPQSQRDATSKGNEPSSVKRESSSQETPLTYTKIEVDKMVSDAAMVIGREKKLVEFERDQLKTQIKSFENKVTDHQEELASLEKRIAELASNDPELNNLEKRAKEVREQERQAKAKLHDAEAKEAEIAEAKNEIATWKRDQLIYSVADDFVTVDGSNVGFDSFKARADLFNISEKEALVALAETMGFKPKTEGEPETKSPSTGRPYSGVTSGGTSFVRNKANPTETLIHGFEKLKQRT